MSVSAKLRSQRGLTLVELLIVVAIIGVLSTIGVPTFRKMIQKAKKSEAKVNLGGLYTAEQAFYSEYGIFGNNLTALGFEIDGQTPLYAVGFMSGSCGSLAHLPDRTADATPLSQAMYRAYSAYDADPKTTVVGNDNDGVDDAGPIPGMTTCELPTTTQMNRYRTAGTAANNVFSESAEYDGFIAAAIGVISPNVNPTSPAAGTSDMWLINHRRLLGNERDGVGKRQ